MTRAGHSPTFVLLIDREQEVGPIGRLQVVGVQGGAQIQIQVRWSGCVRLAVAGAAQPGYPIFGILRTISLLWLLLGQSLNSVHNRMANLNTRSQDIKN
jgi:hypothetical protein